MSKVLSYILVFSLTLSMIICFTGCDENNENSTTGNTDQTVTSSDTESTVSKTDSVSSEATISDKPEASKPAQPTQPAKPTKLNPKTNLKFDSYYKAEFFGADGKSYHVIRLLFYEYEDFSEYDYISNGVTFSETNYYNKEYCEKQYADWGMEFKEENFNKNEYIIKNNVKYFNLGTGGSCLDSYDLTDTSIKLTEGENTDILYIQQNGDLVIETVTTKNRYGAVGTVFTLEKF